MFIVVRIAFAAISFVACGGSSDEPAVTSTYSIVFSSENDVCGTVSGKDSSGAAVSSGAKFEKYTALTLTATANAGYVFSGWYEGT